MNWGWFLLEESLMKSFKFNVPNRRKVFSRFLYDIYNELFQAYEQKKEKEGLTKKEIAVRLNKDQAAITRWFNGNGNMTLETVSDLMWAMDHRPTFQAIECNEIEENNVSWHQVKCDQYDDMGKITSCFSLDDDEITNTASKNIVPNRKANIKINESQWATLS